MRFNLVSLLSVACATQGVAAFTSRIGSSSFGLSTRSSAYRSTNSQLHVLPPEFHDTASIQNLFDVLSASTFLADASAAVADATAAVVDVADAADVDGGWWQNYLDVFRNGLLFVHDSVDQPLRDKGIEQTWGVSIAIFTAFVRMCLLPLSYEQSKSAEYTKALKPYQDEIKQKFKDNKDMQNRAIAKLFEDSNVNPLNGCLLSLAQLPIFIGLYRSVTALAQEGRLSEPFLFIPSLGGPVSPPTYRGMEWLTQGWTFDGIPTPQLGWETTLAFLIMPVVLVLGQAATMSLLTPPIDENATAEEKETLEKSQRILKFLPLMIGYFSLQVPAGLTIYWFTSNLFTTVQSLVIRAYYQLNPPKIDLPDYWDALDDVSKMSPEERRKAAEAGINTGPTFTDMMDEAKFHVVIERDPIRLGSPAWERAQKSGSIPAEFTEWVASGKSTTHKVEKEVTHSAKLGDEIVLEKKAAGVQ